jgi:Tfp pilus assembly protein PilP
MKLYLKIKLLVPVILLVISTGAMAQARDPFSPNGTNVLNKMKDLVGGAADNQLPKFDNSNPLTATQLMGYKVTGVIISEKQKVASVKTINGGSFTVKIGDNLGSEGGKISDITLDGISVQTESQEVKLPVNNKVEVPLANAAEKKN